MAAESDRAVAVLDDFVLEDETRARVRIERVGGTILVAFLDSDDDPLPGSPVELSQDFSESSGPITIAAYWAPARRLRIAEDAGHDGLLRVFVAYGSKSTRFYQYARSDVSLDMNAAGEGVVTEGTPWRLDLRSPYGGSFASDALDATVMFDGPGTSPDFDPFEAVMRMAKAGGEERPRDVLERSVFTLTHEFETLPNVDGVLLGSIMWGYTLTWTFAGGVSAGPEPRPVTPVWRSPETTPSTMPDNLGTSWNPRVRSTKT